MGRFDRITNESFGVPEVSKLTVGNMMSYTQTKLALIIV